MKNEILSVKNQDQEVALTFKLKDAYSVHLAIFLPAETQRSCRMGLQSLVTVFHFLHHAVELYHLQVPRKQPC